MPFAERYGHKNENYTSGTSYSYTYNVFGNRHTVTASGIESYTTGYDYDKNNRLLTETKTMSGVTETTKYTYDPNGNTLSAMSGSISASSIPMSASINQNMGQSAVYEYDVYNRLTTAFKDDVRATYAYNGDGLRTSKTVNGTKTGFIWDGANIAGEITGSAVKTYMRGLNLLHSNTGGTKAYYQFNSHGDVTSLINSSGTVTKRYAYNAFGQEISPDANDTNPFRFCGEYYCESSGLYLIGARAYDASIGRWTQEDPIKFGNNWYVFCSNDPINRIDPTGLFDYNTRLSYNQDYNDDVKVLQNALVNQGYLDMSGGGWGYYGTKTQAAVNAFKNDMGLGNTGKDAGVVGLQTWTSLGLTTYRTQEDIDAGVTIATIGFNQYKDVSVPINNALNRDKGTFAENSGDFNWFKNQVNHEADWDIKRKDPWERTIGSTFPGSYNTTVILFGTFTTPEALGNITYGYLGTAAGFNETTLIAGSMYAAGIWSIITDGSARSNEFNDHGAIRQGINWFNGR